MNAVQICAIGIVAVFTVIILKDSGAPHPEAIVLIMGVLVLLRVSENISRVIEFIFEISDGTTVESYVKVLIKASGIAYVVDFASGICRDAGEGGVAEYVEIAGKCEIVLLTLPIAKELIEISMGMLNL